MSDDNPHSASGSSQKSWAAKLLQVFAGEPKSREELVDLIQDAEERDLIDNDTKEMIEGVLDVAELKVRDIMIPRSQMVTIDIHQSVEEFLPIVIESQHSRYPVVTDNKDHVEGILLAKDLLSYGFNFTEDSFSLSEVMRPAVIGQRANGLMCCLTSLGLTAIIWRSSSTSMVVYRAWSPSRIS